MTAQQIGPEVRSLMRNYLRRGFISRLVASCASALAAWHFLGAGRARAQASVGVSRFDHVAVPMRNSEAMARFYRALGFKVNEGERICSVHFGDHKINFHQPALWQSAKF